jgi:hypothetical protein
MAQILFLRATEIGARVASDESLNRHAVSKEVKPFGLASRAFHRAKSAVHAYASTISGYGMSLRLGPGLGEKRQRLTVRPCEPAGSRQPSASRCLKKDSEPLTAEQSAREVSEAKRTARGTGLTRRRSRWRHPYPPATRWRRTFVRPPPAHRARALPAVGHGRTPDRWSATSSRIAETTQPLKQRRPRASSRRRAPRIRHPLPIPPSRPCPRAGSLRAPAPSPPLPDRNQRLAATFLQ